MRIVILTETFGRNTGYIGNMLPKYLARAGQEVNLVSMDLPPYYHLPEFSRTYSKFTGGEVLHPGTVEEIDGFTLHVLGHRCRLGYNRFVGLQAKLESLRPDIVQTSVAIGWVALDAARMQRRLRYKLFTGSHTTASIFPLARPSAGFQPVRRLLTLLKRGLPGRLISLRTEKCYGATSDCAEVAVRFFGVPRNKMEICPLGVDTDLFRPLEGEAEAIARQRMRERFGIEPEEILCVYSGRFSLDKNPLLLGEAIAQLRGEGKPFRGLFVGDGVQADAIAAQPGCMVHPFVPIRELPAVFQAADIGVWPAQESMSMLDAAACGLPIVVNDTIQALERVEGNGLLYRLHDVDDMMRVLGILQDPDRRRQMGRAGAVRMARQFSWESIARNRLKDYSAALADRIS